MSSRSPSGRSLRALSLGHSSEREENAEKRASMGEGVVCKSSIKSALLLGANPASSEDSPVSIHYSPS